MSFSRVFLMGSACIGCIAILVVREQSVAPDGKTHVQFLAKEKGDSLMIVTPQGKRILLDAGSDTEPMEEWGKQAPLLDHRIDLLILTHPDSKRTAMLLGFLERYDVRTVLCTGENQLSGRYQAARSFIGDHAIPTLFAEAGMTITIEKNMELDILWPAENLQDGDEPKDSSIVLRIHTPHASLLVSGSIPGTLRKKLLRSGVDIHADIWILPSGSTQAQIDELLPFIEPEKVILPSGHPNLSIPVQTMTRANAIVL